MEHVKQAGREATKPLGDQIVRLWVCVSKESYISIKMLPIRSDQAEYNAVTDTGARTTKAGTAFLRALGLKEENLFELKQKLLFADKSWLDIF